MIPVVLFVYRRVDMLEQTLAGLRANAVPKLIVYSDGPKTPEDADAVSKVRECLSKIDWCDVEKHYSDANIGLGKSILNGVSNVLSRYESCIVFEDDLVSVPGMYKWLCAALNHYKEDKRVFSVTAWTNGAITPKDVGDSPFFNGRADSLAWGTWRRAWRGMEDETALEKMSKAIANGCNPYFYGGDLPYTARVETRKNLWAVRFCFHHIVNGGLTLHPQRSLVNHIGWGRGATNENKANWIDNGKLKQAPSIPKVWPEPIEHPLSAELLRKAYPRPWVDRFPRLVPIVRKMLTCFSAKR